MILPAVDDRRCCPWGAGSRERRHFVTMLRTQVCSPRYACVLKTFDPSLTAVSDHRLGVVLCALVGGSCNSLPQDSSVVSLVCPPGVGDLISRFSSYNCCKMLAESMPVMYGRDQTRPLFESRGHFALGQLPVEDNGLAKYHPMPSDDINPNGCDPALYPW